MNQYWNEGSSQTTNKRHVPLTLVDTFKQQTGIKFYTQPLAWKTREGRFLATWFVRVRAWIVTDLMFINESKKTKMSVAEMDRWFHELLRAVQNRCPNLIADSVKIEDDYNMKRSLRWGATAEAQNAHIPTNVIEANNRWRKVLRAKGMTSGMSVMEWYTDAKAIVPLLIRFFYCIGWSSLKSKRLEWYRIVGGSGHTSNVETQNPNITTLRDGMHVGYFVKMRSVLK